MTKREITDPTVNLSGVVEIESNRSKIPGSPNFGDSTTLTDLRGVLLKWAANGVTQEQAAADFLAIGVNLAKDVTGNIGAVAHAVESMLLFRPSEHVTLTTGGIGWDEDMAREEQRRVRNMIAARVDSALDESEG